MDAKELVERIEGYQGKLPNPRFVAHAYAEVISKIADRMSPAEMEDLIALGALVKRRSSQLVPLYEWDKIPEELLKVRPVVE